MQPLLQRYKKQGSQVLCAFYLKMLCVCVLPPGSYIQCFFVFFLSSHVPTQLFCVTPHWAARCKASRVSHAVLCPWWILCSYGWPTGLIWFETQTSLFPLQRSPCAPTTTRSTSIRKMGPSGPKSMSWRNTTGRWQVRHSNTKTS